MSLRDILDSSIVEEPPPFPDLDELIARERRRQRRIRWAAAVTGAAGVVGAVLGVTLVAGGLGRAPAAGLPEAPPPAPESSVSVTADHSAAVQCSRNGALAWTRRIVPARTEQTRRWKVHTSIGK